MANPKEVTVTLERTKMTKNGLGRYQGDHGERGDKDYVGVTIYLGEEYVPGVLAEIKVKVEVP